MLGPDANARRSTIPGVACPGLQRVPERFAARQARFAAIQERFAASLAAFPARFAALQARLEASLAAVHTRFAALHARFEAPLETFHARLAALRARFKASLHACARAFGLAHAGPTAAWVRSALPPACTGVRVRKPLGSEVRRHQRAPSCGSESRRGPNCAGVRKAPGSELRRGPK